MAPPKAGTPADGMRAFVDRSDVQSCIVSKKSDQCWLFGERKDLAYDSLLEVLLEVTVAI